MNAVNFVIIFTSYRISNGNMLADEICVYSIVAVNTILCGVCGYTSYYLSPDEFKINILKYNSLSDYLYYYCWCESQENIYRNKSIETQEEIRAKMALHYSLCYIPKYHIIRFYSVNWTKWEILPPTWFNDDFVNAIPRELLVGVRQFDSENV